MTVDFKFSVSQAVKTCFDDIGVIEMCGIDDSNDKKYFVMREKENKWFRECQLSEHTTKRSKKVVL